MRLSEFSVWEVRVYVILALAILIANSTDLLRPRGGIRASSEGSGSSSASPSSDGIVLSTPIGSSYKASVVDAVGNIYVIGTYFEDFEFLIPNGSVFSDVNNSGYYLMKISPDDQVLFSIPVDLSVDFRDIAITSSGDFVLVGKATGPGTPSS